MEKPFLFIIICIIILIVVPLIAEAAVTACNCNNAPAGTVCIPDPLQCKSIDEIIAAIVNLIVAIGLGVGVIMIIWSAILYMTSGGSEQRVTTARKALMWTVIGIAILMSARFIILLIVEVLSGP